MTPLPFKKILALLMLMGCTSLPAVAAEPLTRTLEVKVDVDAAQDWKNAPQWYEATSEQHFTVRTQLRSDGRLHAANLLDTDTQMRLAVKSEYLRQKGLARLRAEGIDPSSPEFQQQISRRMQEENFACKGEMVCMGEVNTKYAMMMAAAMEPDNSALFEGEPRYQFFEPFRGCQSTVKGSVRISTEGETTYGKKKEVFPYTQEMAGTEQVTPEAQAALCNFFLVVVDTRDGKMYVENVFFPDVKGTERRTEFEKTHELDNVAVPMAPPLQDWVNATLRGPVAYSGEASAALPLILPLDGDATILGKFTGEAKTQMAWSFQ